MPHGSYTLELEDAALWEQYQRNAQVVFFYPSSTSTEQGYTQMTNVSLIGTSSQTIELNPAALVEEEGEEGEEGGKWYQSGAFIVSVVVVGTIVGVGFVLW